MITRKDVAKLAGVSEATVSYVINNSKNVSDKVRQRVLEATKELDYRPNLVARSLVTKQTKHVAMLVDNLKNPHYCEMLEGAQTVASENGYIVSVIAIDTSNRESVMELADRGVDGVMLALGSHAVNEYLKPSIPAVYAGDHVIINYRDAIFDMMQKLYDNGHRKVAFLSGLPLTDPNHVRYRDYLDTLKHFGLSINENLIVDAEPSGRTDESAGAQAMQKLLERKEAFSAIFAVNDLMAIGAMRVLHGEGLRVPEDISVVGCDNLKLFDTIVPSLSSIDTHSYETGCSLMRLLIESIDKKPQHDKKIVATFVSKESIGKSKI